MNKNLLYIAVALASIAPAKSMAQATINVKDESAIVDMTYQSFENFKANKWAQFDNGAYWGWQTKDGDGYRYYWEQMLCTMATADIAEYGTNEDAKTMISQNLDGFIAKYGDGVGVGWNDYIDDIGWAECGFALGYRITHNPTYLNKAIRLFNTGFKRGNLGPYKEVANKNQDGSEGLWWRVDHSRWQPSNELATAGTEGNGIVIKNNDFYKSPLATSPHVTTGAYLYSFTGDESYLQKAIKMWQWEVNTLWNYDDDSGIYEGYDPYRAEIVDKDGNTQPERPEGYRTRRTMHDLSSFFEATNALWKCTGEEIYLAWCWKIVNSVLQYRLDGNGIIQNAFSARDGSWCWEAGRAWSMFCADNDLWDFKGQVPDMNGTYTDYTGKTKTYTSRVKGNLNSFPNGWTLYQFMAASASRIKNDNGTCIILPTNRDADVWETKGRTTLDIEAESGTFENGKDASQQLTIQNDNRASAGKTVANVGNGNWIKYTTEEMRADYYNIFISYAADTDCKLTVKVGDQIVTVDCPKTGNGTRFRYGNGTICVSIPLAQGINTIEVGGDDANGPVIDRLSLRRVSGLDKSTTIEAEKTTLDEGTTTRTDNWASNGSTVTGLGNGHWSTFNYDALVNGYYTIDVQYAAAEDLHLALQANGGEVIDSICSKTGSGDRFRLGNSVVTYQVYLHRGNNTIKIGGDNGAAPVVDKYVVTFTSFNPVVTGIKTISVDTDSKSIDKKVEGWYTLQGVRIDKPVAKGVYIHNGKKVVVK